MSLKLFNKPISERKPDDVVCFYDGEDDPFLALSNELLREMDAELAAKKLEESIRWDFRLVPYGYQGQRWYSRRHYMGRHARS